MHPALFVLPLLLAACGPVLGTSSNSEIRKGKALYGENCAACHGADAWGAGAASLGLGAPPPDLTTLSSRNGGAFPTDYVLDTIEGKSRMADPDAAMPQFEEVTGDTEASLAGMPEDGPSLDRDTEMAAIAAYLETLQVR